MLTRRSFLSFLAAVPVVGRFVPQEPEYECGWCCGCEKNTGCVVNPPQTTARRQIVSIYGPTFISIEEARRKFPQAFGLPDIPPMPPDQLEIARKITEDRHA